MAPELLARAWAAGAGPGSEPFTIDLDSTICDTYGLADPVAKRLDADLERAALGFYRYFDDGASGTAPASSTHDSSRLASPTP